MNHYKPEPLDTKAIALPDDLQQLLERLAENTHDVWARQRMADGWTWGPHRDDAAKKNPCLVPYAELPESEKVYDRQTAGEVLKAILKLGYKVRREG
jgi:RyR domain